MPDLSVARRLPLSRLPLGRLPLGRLPLGRLPLGRLPLGHLPQPEPGSQRARPAWWPAWSVPAALRTLRAVLVVPSLFALTYEGFGNLQMALFAAFGGFAHLVFAAFG